MVDGERVRVEIGFVSGSMVIASIPLGEADVLQQKLRERADETVELQGEDGVYGSPSPMSPTSSASRARAGSASATRDAGVYNPAGWASMGVADGSGRGAPAPRRPRST